MKRMKIASDDGILERIQEALNAAVEASKPFIRRNVRVDYKSNSDPVTEVDLAVNRVLREILVQNGEGWLSEESEDDRGRLGKRRVWIVDPLDGTREFLAGIPEWCVSVGLSEGGKAVAGGICNPATGEIILGSLDHGVTYNGQAACASQKTSLEGASVLASRSEVARGEWERFQASSLLIRPVGSVAYKLALVAAGKADATWTLTPKHEWDIAAGVALVESGGGFVAALAGPSPRFNEERTLSPGLIACGPNLRDPLATLLHADIRFGSQQGL
jgi:myo-inositol-1(or 4)-monophosphatase